MTTRTSQCTYIPELGCNVLFNHSKRARRLSITVKPDASVRVTIPRAASRKAAEQFLASKQHWIRKHLQRITQRPRTAPPRPMHPIDRIRAGRILAGRLNELARRHQFTYNRLTIRRQRTRWGSCSDKNNISLNARLINLPPELIDYVLLHELLHTRIKNHGPQFWAEMHRLLPDTPTLRRQLKKHRCTD
ncbi:MAG TPA: M48 family peptidase [Phycisphaerales bacterium]|nr:M48 family peptidase [Phycisphaerales bacterium]